MRKWTEWLLVCCVLTAVLTVLIPHLPAGLKKVGLLTVIVSFIAAFAYRQFYEYCSLTRKNIALCLTLILLLTIHVASTYESYRIWYVETVAEINAKIDENPLGELVFEMAKTQADSSDDAAELNAVRDPGFSRFLVWKYSNVAPMSEKLALAIWIVEITVASLVAGFVVFRPWQRNNENSREAPQSDDGEVTT